MKNLRAKFALIAITTLAGLLAIWPPSQKLKLGIDLSGGTILVYEVVKENMPANFNMDELMTVGERRLNLLRLFNAREGLSRKDYKHSKFGDRDLKAMHRPLEQAGKKEEAIKVYRKLLEDYPGTQFDDAAKRELLKLNVML